MSKSSNLMSYIIAGAISCIVCILILALPECVDIALCDDISGMQ